MVRLDDQALRFDPPSIAFLEYRQPMRDLFAELRHERIVGRRSVYRVDVVHKLGWSVVVHTLETCWIYTLGVYDFGSLLSQCIVHCAIETS